MSTDSKPCPFCGSATTLDDERLLWVASCTGCGACVLGDRAPEPVQEMPAAYWEPFRQSAVDRWNRRAALVAQPDPVASTAWMYQGEPDFDGEHWRENWKTTLDEKLARYMSGKKEPIPLWCRPTPQSDPESLLARIDTLLDGIDRDECHPDGGWWQTSDGSTFGRIKLRELKELVSAAHLAQPEPLAPTDEVGA